MLKITDAAWKRLAELQATRPKVTAFRLRFDGQRIVCHRGRPKDHDRVMVQDGCPSLLMTPDVANDLHGRTLDAPETRRGRRLRLADAN